MEQVRNVFSNIFGSISILSIPATHWLGQVSQFCALILPIIGVLSGLLLLIINFNKIAEMLVNKFCKKRLK